MFLYKIPKLEPGPLKKEILWRMRDIPLNEMEIRYHTYSNGIISGCELFEENGKIGVQPGIIKYSNRLYFLTEKSSVEYKPTDSWTVLKIKFSPQKHHPEYTWFEGNLSLDENVNVLPNEIEVGRFKLKVGSRLRTTYKNFEDMRTEYDTVNLTHVHWSIAGDYTLHPEIMLHYAREAYPHVCEKALDCSFCTTILANNGVVSRESIQRFISVKSGEEYVELDSKELFDRLANYLLEFAGKEKVGQSTSDGIYVF